MDTGRRFLRMVNAVMPDHGWNCWWGPGMRDIYILHHVLSGSGYLECGGKVHRVESGQSFMIMPDTLVHYYPDPADPWNYIWLDFSGEGAAELVAQTGFSAAHPVCGGVTEDIVALHLEAARNFKTDTPAQISRNTARLHLVMSRYMEIYPGSPEKTENPLLSRALEWIEQNYRQPELTVDAIAAQLHVNRVSLYRCFQRELGISPIQYLTQYRIRRACRMLKNGAPSVKVAAYSVGFSDQLYFSKVFKGHMGMTPSEYQRESERF